jgi:membrane protein DedA with SNARE-associated domain
MSQAELIELFTQYAYEPWIVYGLIIAMLTASSFGLPIPEEVTIISAGVVGYIVSHPQKFIPTEGSSQAVTAWGLALVCFLAVFLSDLLVFGIGRWARSHVSDSNRFAKVLKSAMFTKASELIEKHGMIMVATFRFTPGIRFPGHLACGFMQIPTWKFFAVDGLAALLSVPTQVLLIAFYGDVILDYLKQFKIALVVVIVILLFFYFLRSRFLKRSK